MNALTIVLRSTASFQELQAIRAAAVKLTWKDAKERLVKAIIDRLLPLKYATPHLLIPTIQDWKYINDKKFVLKASKEANLKMLKVHVDEDEVLRMGVSFLSPDRRLKGRIIETISSGLSDPPSSSRENESVEEEKQTSEKENEAEFSDQNSSAPDMPGSDTDTPTKSTKRKSKENAPGEPPVKKPRGKKKDSKPSNSSLPRSKPVEPLCNCDKGISAD